VELVGAYYNYWIASILMMVGFYAVIAKSNLVKKTIGLGLFQTGIFLFYISVAKRLDGTVPVRMGEDNVYSNPLPHALILTAIVVGVSVLAVALSLVVCIREDYGTVDEGDIGELEAEEDLEALKSRKQT
jgi:multicomponent Na+:H+ antiporter subunit C